MSINYWQDFEEGKFYHIYNKSAYDLTLFQEKEDFTDFLNKLKSYFSNYLEIYAYCLIPNHFHLLIKVKFLEEVIPFVDNVNSVSASKLLKKEISHSEYLISIFKNFFSSIAITYKNKYEHSGQVFLKKFKRVQIASESKLLYIFCYIHHNPIHHHLVANFENWKWSSYLAYCSNSPSLLKRDDFLEWLGGYQVFQEIHENFKLEKKLECIELRD